MESLVELIFGPAVPDPNVWHRVPLLFHLWLPLAYWLPVRTLDGDVADGSGKLWRRRRAGRWEYQQDAETADEFAERNW